MNNGQHSKYLRYAEIFDEIVVDFCLTPKCDQITNKFHSAVKDSQRFLKIEWCVIESTKIIVIIEFCALKLIDTQPNEKFKMKTN